MDYEGSFVSINTVFRMIIAKGLQLIGFSPSLIMESNVSLGMGQSIYDDDIVGGLPKQKL